MTYPVLQDKVAIITGAAMGMGAATAQLFAEAGAKVVVADFTEDKGREVVAGIEAAGGIAFFQRLDISNSDQVKAMVAATVDRYGRLDAAVNNAALTPDDKPMAEFDEAYWDRLMSVDLKGTALCMKWELQQMIRQGGGGSIINISSVSGFRPQPTPPPTSPPNTASTDSPKSPHSRTGLSTSASTPSPPARSTPRCCAAHSNSSASPKRTTRHSSASSTVSDNHARSPKPACGSPPTSPPTSPAPSSTSTPATPAADLAHREADRHGHRPRTPSSDSSTTRG